MLLVLRGCGIRRQVCQCVRMFRVNLLFQGLQICQRFVKGGSMHVTPFAGGQCGLLLLLMDQGIDGVMKASAADAGNQATS